MVATRELAGGRRSDSSHRCDQRSKRRVRRRSPRPCGSGCKRRIPANRRSPAPTHAKRSQQATSASKRSSSANANPLAAANTSRRAPPLPSRAPHYATVERSGLGGRSRLAEEELQVVRRDRLGGLIHEYYRAA